MTEPVPGADIGAGGRRDPIDVLIVASWFPAYDDAAAGRFVADQAEALLATGAARPAVVTFDGIRLSGGATARAHQADVALRASVAAAGDASLPFVPLDLGSGRPIPVGRLSIPEGPTPSTGADHAAAHRRAVLEAFAERLANAADGKAGRGIVHAHTVYPDGAASVALADRLGWPLVVTEHSSFVERIVGTPALRERYASTLAGAARVLAVSEMLASELRTAFPEHAAKIAVLPNSVPVERFTPGGEDGRVADELLFVGYRKPSKGIENLLRAVAVARAARPSVTLRLLGRSPDGATEARWKQLAQSLGIAEAVSFEEPVDRRGIAAAMARASVFVHPSPRETFGVVAVEALASGLPVVATDSGGVSEILGDEPDKLGGLVPPDDPEALGRAIVATLERRSAFDPAELRASVERRFGSAFVAERLLVLYRELLAPMAPPGDGLPIRAEPPTAALPPVVVALDRERAALRLGPLPEALRGQLVLLTAVEPAEVTLPRLGRAVEVHVDAAWRPKPRPSGRGLGSRPGLVGRLARLASDPIGTVGRRLGRGTGSEGEVAPATQALRRFLGESPAAGDVLPLDGHDHLAVAPLVADGTARLSAGGLRRLADAWHARRGVS